MNSQHLLIVLGSVFALGMRHGIDHDHIAAITDLASLQTSARRSMRLGMVYAGGHALVLLALGIGAVLIGLRLPEGWDVWREKIVGATLIALGLSVAASMIARRGKLHEPHRAITRASLLLRLIQSFAAWFRRLIGAAPAVETRAAGETPAFLMGILHGLGAETPSQMLLLVVAAGMGAAVGLWCIGAFVVGLFITNTIMCAVVVGLYGRQVLRRRINFVLSGLCAAYSVGVGIFYLMGAGAKLPDIG